MLHIFSIEGDQLTELGAIALSMPVAHNISQITKLSLNGEPVNKLVVPLSDNTTRLIDIPTTY